MFQRMNFYLRNLGLRGLLCAIKAWLTNSTVYFEVKRRDCKFPFLLRVPSSDVPTYEQIFVRRDYDFSVAVQPEVIIDAGANVGVASIYFANKFPDATIIAIEPEQSNYELLKKNTAPYPHVVPVQGALWNKNEEVIVIDPGLGNWGFMTVIKHLSRDPRSNTCHAVMGVTIDKLMADYNLSKIDILKVDIEGAEKEVFSDTSPWIDAVESIVIELHDRLKAGCNSSFYGGLDGFDSEWTQGENIFVSRGNYLTKHVG